MCKLKEVMKVAIPASRMGNLERETMGRKN